MKIDEDQAPWSPKYNGAIKVSNLQTGSFSGRLGSAVGQHQFTSGLVVQEEQPETRLYLPERGLVEVRARAITHPQCMVALWLIGFEDEPSRSGEICIMEIFGKDVGQASGLVGLGVHPFGDPALSEDFGKVRVSGDLTDFHTYAATWDSKRIDFYIDDLLVKTSTQAPQYPMQLMLNIYQFPEASAVAEGEGEGEGEGEEEEEEEEEEVGRVFIVDYVRGWTTAEG
ncbi:glycosyl hydrolase family protein [Cryobacterium sp. TMT2-15-1]|uniref:glycoside hydrolase family 16 protein n=1 Tax=Cryobacterium sp. TMT2-15-1 TaxID=1259246 RepID=UPI00106C0526|nr:glycoside hydrolase family 16 protein [Cryobacterium sp. TMT2-15-1]TFC55445.1 glycosyl hydrolase family protein [Cryobacterium sp. TMT2-15-1]